MVKFIYVRFKVNAIRKVNDYIRLNLTDSDLLRGKERKVTKLGLIIRKNFLNKTELILGLDSEKFLKLDRVDGSVSWWILGMFYDDRSTI